MKKYFKFIIAFVLMMLMFSTTAMAAGKIAGGTLDNGILWSFYDYIIMGDRMIL